MAIRTFTVDAETVRVFKERGRGDGGLVICAAVEESDKEFSIFRHWFSDPALARTVYDNLTVGQLRQYLSKAGRGGAPRSVSVPVLKTLTVDGEQVIVYAEKAATGTVVCIMVEEADGEYTSFRHKFANPDLARQRLQDATMADLRAAIAKGRSFEKDET